MKIRNIAIAVIFAIAGIFALPQIGISDDFRTVSRYIIAERNDTLSVDLFTATENIRLYAQAIAHMESDMKNVSTTLNSTASGYFQFVNGSFALAKKRLDKVFDADWLMVGKVTSLSYEQQATLAIYDLYAKAPQSFSKVISGDKEAMFAVYCKYHHTACGDVETARFERILSEYTFNQERSLAYEPLFSENRDIQYIWKAK